MATNKVSFTIRQPTPLSRSDSESDSALTPAAAVPRRLYTSLPGSPLARSTTSSPQPQSDSDSDNEVQDELVTGFDKFGVERCVTFLASYPQPSQLTPVSFNVLNYRAHKSNKPVHRTPLVIAPLKDRDWRELARKRRSAGHFVPASAKAQDGPDGSAGGLGLRDTINTGPVLSGLQIRKRSVVSQQNETVVQSETRQEGVVMEETEDQKAIRAILAEAQGQTDDAPLVDIIPTSVSEAEALRQDMEGLPDPSSLEDYARVPVSQFGAALLRGMGWKEGTAASRKPGKGLVQPYLPEARPALLGIGAKEQEVYDDGSTRKGTKRPERRYVPVVRKDRDGNVVPEKQRRSRSPKHSNGSGRNSRRSSRSPDRSSRHYDDHRKDGRERDRDYDREHRRDRDRRRDRKDY